MRTLLRALVVLTATAMPAVAQQEPPRRLDLSNEAAAQDTTPRVRGETTREMRTKFVRSQTILGLAAYGPTFATMVGDDGVRATAGYLVMAGGSFFIATELTRQLEITPARHFLAGRMAWRGTVNGLVLGNAMDLDSHHQIAGVAWLLGIGGAAGGLYGGRNLSEGEAVAMVVGHYIAYLSSIAVGYLIDPNDDDREGLSWQARSIGSTVIGWGGYALGRVYATRVPYNVTPGDAMLLWLGAGIGGTAAASFIANGDPPPQTIAGVLLGGSLLGLVGADRYLVRPYDHSTAEGSLVALGGVAGALMGIGVGVLIVGEADRGAATTMFSGAVGAAAGALLTERYAQPTADAGRQFGARRVEFSPLGAVAAAAGTPGRHSILRITF